MAAIRRIVGCNSIMWGVGHKTMCRTMREAAHSVGHDLAVPSRAARQATDVARVAPRKIPRKTPKKQHALRHGEVGAIFLQRVAGAIFFEI